MSRLHQSTYSRISSASKRAGYPDLRGSEVDSNNTMGAIWSGLRCSRSGSRHNDRYFAIYKTKRISSFIKIIKSKSYLSSTEADNQKADSTSEFTISVAGSRVSILMDSDVVKDVVQLNGD